MIWYAYIAEGKSDTGWVPLIAVVSAPGEAVKDIMELAKPEHLDSLRVKRINTVQDFHDLVVQGVELRVADAYDGGPITVEGGAVIISEMNPGEDQDDEL